MLVSRGDKGLSPELNIEKERALKLKWPADESGCRQLTSKFSLYSESNKDQSLNKTYQARNAPANWSFSDFLVRILLVFLSEIYLQSKLLPGESSCNQPALDGKTCQLCVVSQVELLEQPRSVSVHGFYAYVVSLGNLPCGLTECQPSEHLDLSVGQSICRRTTWRSTGHA